MKETYYFSHDYNPTNDPKIVCLIGNYGGLGYGVFWRIIEMLHQEDENKLPLKLYIYEAIAKQMLTSAEQIKTIINSCLNEYELFSADDDYFWSNRVLRNIEKRQEISEKRRLSGKAGAIAKQMLASAKQSSTNISKGKERKGKEIIIKGSDKSPTPKEIVNDFFINPEKQLKISEELKKKGINEELIKIELNKFIMYWTEPDGSGKHQRWEKEKVFEINRRLTTWFSRVNQFTSTNTNTNNNNRKKNRDGQWCIKKFGNWVLESNPAINIDLRYYPELEN